MTIPRAFDANAVACPPEADRGAAGADTAVASGIADTGVVQAGIGIAATVVDGATFRRVAGVTVGVTQSPVRAVTVARTLDADAITRRSETNRCRATASRLLRVAEAGAVEADIASIRAFRVGPTAGSTGVTGGAVLTFRALAVPGALHADVGLGITRRGGASTVTIPRALDAGMRPVVADGSRAPAITVSSAFNTGTLPYGPETDWPAATACTFLRITDAGVIETTIAVASALAIGPTANGADIARRAVLAAGAVAIRDARDAGVAICIADRCRSLTVAVLSAGDAHSLKAAARTEANRC